MPPKQPDPKPTKKTSTGVLAGRLYERALKLNAEKKAELRRLPESVEERYAKKLNAMFASADPVVAALAAKMLDDGDEGPESE